MCARFSLAAPDRVAARYPAFKKPQRPYPPRFNIAPTQDVLAARNDGDGELTTLRWGLVPFWARDHANAQKMINARVETLAEKPAFRTALERRRCVIFADGFYEWTGPKKQRQPYRFTVGDDAVPFAFAGLYENWGPRDARVETCTIVTCPPNALLTPFHDRMPAMLADDAVDVWLHGDVPAALATIVPFDTTQMRATPVTPAMNDPAFEDPRALEPAPVEQSLF